MSFRGELRSGGARLLQEIAGAGVSLGVLVVVFGLLPWLAGLRQTRWLVLGLLAWLTACAVEQGLRAGTHSLCCGRTIGLVFFAAGCRRFGVFTYASADWPVWLELIGAVRRWV